MRFMLDTRTILASFLLCGLATAQQPANEVYPTEVESTVPANGAQGVLPDRATSLFFNRGLSASTLTGQSVYAVSGSTAIQAELRLSLNQRVVTLVYPYFLPGNAQVTVTIDGDRLLDVDGRGVDGDHDGAPGGVGMIQFTTGPALPPPMKTGTAVITGYVFDAAGAPLQGATAQGWLYPRVEGQPPLPVPAGISNAQGFFQYTTPQFTGTETFLIEVHKTGMSESLRRVEVLAQGCWRVDDSKLQAVAPKQMVTVGGGATVPDPTGQVKLIIPPGALQQNSNVGVTLLDSSEFLRDELPPLVAEGSFVDVAGVFGEATNVPVTIEVPNVHNLPVGARVPFGKIDHNTLEWTDLRDLYTGPPPVPDEYLGKVKQRTDGSTYVEIQFDKFCSICTSYCLPFPSPNPSPPPNGNPKPPGCNPGSNPNNSVVDLREGYLRETVELPSLREMEGDFVVSLGYFSGAASPSVTLQAKVDYQSTRPVERTIFRFEIEGVTVEAAYDASKNKQTPLGTFFWDGKNAFGQRLPTGSYPYAIRATSLNARTAVSVPTVFGGSSVQSFNETYPGLTPLRTEMAGRVVLLDLQGSPYGAGWRIAEAPQLYFDSDGCIVLVEGNSEWQRYEPDPGTQNLWTSPPYDPSRMVFNPATGGFVRTFPDGDQQVFDQNGRVERITDRFGHETTFAYTGGLLTSITSPTGHRIDLAYDGAGKLSSASDSAGRQTQFTVDAAGDLVAVTDALGAVRQFQYDSAHRLSSQTGSRGERSEYVYRQGRVAEARAFDVNGTTLLRRRTFEPSVVAGEIGMAQSMGQGSLLDPIPLVESRADKLTDGRGVTSVHEVDDNWQTKSFRDGLGRETQYVYHPDGRSVGWDRPNGSALRYEYDAQGNISAVRQMRTPTQSYAVRTLTWGGPFDQLTRVVDEEGKTVDYSYDVLGNLIGEQDHDGKRTERFYDDPSFPDLPTRTVGPAGERATITYDAHGNLASYTAFPDPVLNPAGATIQFSRDPAGNVRAITDPIGQTTTYTHDAFNRTKTVTDHLSGTIGFDYGDAGCGCATPNLTKVTFPNASTIVYQYDGLDRLVRRTDQLGKSALFAYDQEGNLLAVNDRNGEQVAYEYDAAGQMVRKLLPGNEHQDFQYDLLGNLAAAADPFCSVQFTRDPFGRVTEAVTILDLPIGTAGAQALAHSIDNTWDRAGNRTRLQDSFGAAGVDFLYDNLHRLARVTLANDPSRQWRFAYDASGRLTSRTQLPAGAGSTWTWDGAAQMTALQHQTTPRIDLTYGYDAAGKAVAADRQVGAQVLSAAYGYDGADRLTGGSLSTVFGEVRVGRSYSHDAANRLLADGEYTYAYDAEGRLVQRQKVGSTLTDLYTYDAEGRLRMQLQTVDNGGMPETVLTARYRYDPLGRRIEKSINGVVTRYVYDGVQVLHEVDFLNRVERSFVHGTSVDEPIALLDAVTGQVLTFHQDRQQSVLGLSDAAGNLVQAYTYDEYGNLLAESDPSYLQPFTYTGRELDPETGAFFYRARTYDSVLGRFLREDPVDIRGGFNLYAYVGNSPVNLTDPTGHGDPFELACVNQCNAAHGRGCGAGDTQECHDKNECEQECKKRVRCVPTGCLNTWNPFGVVKCAIVTAWRCFGS